MSITSFVKRFGMGIGSIFCGISVGLGAFGAHALRRTWEVARLETLETATQYLFLHGLSLIILSFISFSHLYSTQNPAQPENLPVTKHHKFPSFGIFREVFGIFLGTVLFAGSLIGWCFSQWRPLVFLTPIGGTLLIASWGMLSIRFAKRAFTKVT